MLSLTLLTSLWTLFMNVFVLVEWVCWISESGESVRTSCSRTRVFKSWLYDSAKGWDFTESPCFFFFFLHSHFNRNASNYRMFSFHLTSSTFPQLIKLLQPPTGQEVHTSSLKRNLKEDFCLFLNFFIVNQPLLNLWHGRGSHVTSNSLSANYFIFSPSFSCLFIFLRGFKMVVTVVLLGFGHPNHRKKHIFSLMYHSGSSAMQIVVVLFTQVLDIWLWDFFCPPKKLGLSYEQLSQCSLAVIVCFFHRSMVLLSR